MEIHANEQFACTYRSGNIFYRTTSANVYVDYTNMDLAVHIFLVSPIIHCSKNKIGQIPRCLKRFVYFIWRMERTPV